MEILTGRVLVRALEKIQAQLPYNFPGWQIHSDFVSLQTLQLKMDNLETLNDFQRFLGDIHWYVPI